MPRVISDELFGDLISNITQQRLLGIMGKLERLGDESINVTFCGCTENCPGIYYTFEDRKEDETKTNDN